jgi:hypothetical protein
MTLGTLPFADIIIPIHAHVAGLQRVAVDNHKTAPEIVPLGSVRVHYWGPAEQIYAVRDAAEAAVSLGIKVEVAQYEPVPSSEQWAIQLDGEAISYTSWDLSRIGLPSHLDGATMTPHEYRSTELDEHQVLWSAFADITGKNGTTSPVVHRWIRGRG